MGFFLRLVATVDFAHFVRFQALDGLSFQNTTELNREEHNTIALTTKVCAHTSQNTDTKIQNVVNNDDYMIFQGEVMSISLHITCIKKI